MRGTRSISAFSIYGMFKSVLIKSLTFRSVSLHDTFKDPSISKIHKLFLLECPSSLSIFNFIEPISVHSSLFTSFRDWFSAFYSLTRKFISSILLLIEEKSFLTPVHLHCHRVGARGPVLYLILLPCLSLFELAWGLDIGWDEGEILLVQRTTVSALTAPCWHLSCSPPPLLVQDFSPPHHS